MKTYPLNKNTVVALKLIKLYTIMKTNMFSNSSDVNISKTQHWHSVLAVNLVRLTYNSYSSVLCGSLQFGTCVWIKLEALTHKVTY